MLAKIIVCYSPEINICFIFMDGGKRYNILYRLNESQFNEIKDKSKFKNLFNMKHENTEINLKIKRKHVIFTFNNQELKVNILCIKHHIYNIINDQI